MTAATFDLPQVMPADALRVHAAERKGERLAELSLRATRRVGAVLRDLFEGSARHELLIQARQQEAQRPELAASLRRAARATWME